MICPFCFFSQSKVTNSRISRDGKTIKRRRECPKCLKRFTTYERIEEILPVVIKKDGRREVFDRQKIFMGIKKSCEKRPVSVETIDEMVDKIEQEIVEKGEKEISSQEIGEKIMKALQDLDGVAYVRFASVYREFKDVTQFMEEVRDILREKKKGIIEER